MSAREVMDGMEKLLVVMQAAWIEWKHGRGAEAGMQWIENTLIGSGLIPGNEPYCTEAQAFFDANKPDATPLCFCGNPSNISGKQGSFCSWAHHDQVEEGR